MNFGLVALVENFLSFSIICIVFEFFYSFIFFSFWFVDGELQLKSKGRACWRNSESDSCDRVGW